MCERAFVSELDGGCSSPVAAYARTEQGMVVLTGLYYDEETGISRTGRISGPAVEAEKLGRKLARRLRDEPLEEKGMSR